MELRLGELMKINKKWICALLAGVCMNVHASSLVLTLDMNSPVGVPFGATLTLTFANSTDGDTSFGSADFISREWGNLSAIGYPASNFANTTVGITGEVFFDAGVWNFDNAFSYKETDASLNFIPVSLSYVASPRVRGAMMYDRLNGFFPNFYINTAVFDADGKPSDFLAAPVPEPEIYAMMLAGLGLMGVAARRRKAASPV